MDIRSRIKAFEGGRGASSSSLTLSSGEAPKRKVRTWNATGAGTESATTSTSQTKEPSVPSPPERIKQDAEASQEEEAAPGVRALLARYNSGGQPTWPVPKPKPKPAAAVDSFAAESDAAEALAATEVELKAFEVTEETSGTSPIAVKKPPPAVPNRAKPAMVPALNDPLARPPVGNAAESSKSKSAPAPPARINNLASSVDTLSIADSQAGSSTKAEENTAPAPAIPARPSARTSESPTMRSQSPISMGRSSSRTSMNAPPAMPERPPASSAAPTLPQRPTATAAGLASSAAAPPLPRRSGTTTSNAPMPASERTLLPPPSRGSTMSVGRNFATAGPTEVTPVRRAGTVRSAPSDVQPGREAAKRKPSPLDSVDWNFSRPLASRARVTRRPAPKLSNGVRSSPVARKRDPTRVQSRAPDPEARPRYEKLSEMISQGDGRSVGKQSTMSVWKKSKLEAELLEALWSDCLRWQANQGLIDDDLDDEDLAPDSLGREAFVRGMAAIDGELLDRKLQ